MIPSRLLFAPLALNAATLRNRIVMAPMTRCRVSRDHAPLPMAARYYAQRADAGLIVSEGIVVSDRGRGYARTPALHSEHQQQAWRRVTAAVHARGGRIFAQLWHCGRVSAAGVLPPGATPVGPGSKVAACSVMAEDGRHRPCLTPCSVPRSLDTDEMPELIQQFVLAARRALDVGFDGVEIHAANGYLLDQFRCPYLNTRSDAYGGNVEGRCRLTLDVAAAVAHAIGSSHTGLRLSPLGTANDMQPDPEPEATYGYLASRLDRLGLGYLHLADQSGDWIHQRRHPLLRCIRRNFHGTLVLCGGFDLASAEEALQAGSGDLIAFGRPFIANPDLVSRLCHGTPLAPLDHDTLYTGGAHGYVDYAAHVTKPPATRPRRMKRATTAAAPAGS